MAAMASRYCLALRIMTRQVVLTDVQVLSAKAQRKVPSEEMVG